MVVVTFLTVGTTTPWLYVKSVETQNQLMGIMRPSVRKEHTLHIYCPSTLTGKDIMELTKPYCPCGDPPDCGGHNCVYGHSENWHDPNDTCNHIECVNERLNNLPRLVHGLDRWVG